MLRPIHLACFAAIAGFGLAGCVSKGKADAQARDAFLAGQRSAMQQMQLGGPSVTIVGEVKNSIIPWTADLTLAKAVLAAEFYGATDPAQIIVVRSGEEIHVDSKTLLRGEDMALQPRDVIELRR